MLLKRKWTCTSCQKTHDRDVNAAQNILNEGLKILSDCGSQPDVNQKMVEASPLSESMNPGVPLTAMAWVSSNTRALAAFCYAKFVPDM